MLTGAFAALAYTIIAMIGAVSAFVCLQGFRD